MLLNLVLFFIINVVGLSNAFLARRKNIVIKSETSKN